MTTDVKPDTTRTEMAVHVSYAITHLTSAHLSSTRVKGPCFVFILFIGGYPYQIHMEINLRLNAEF